MTDPSTHDIGGYVAQINKLLQRDPERSRSLSVTHYREDEVSIALKCEGEGAKDLLHRGTEADARNCLVLLASQVTGEIVRHYRDRLRVEVSSQTHLMRPRETETSEASDT